MPLDPFFFNRCVCYLCVLLSLSLCFSFVRLLSVCLLYLFSCPLFILLDEGALYHVSVCMRVCVFVCVHEFTVAGL